MKQSLIKRIFGGKPQPATRLLAITPPRTGERTLLGVENLLGSIAPAAKCSGRTRTSATGGASTPRSPFTTAAALAWSGRAWPPTEEQASSAPAEPNPIAPVTRLVEETCRWQTNQERQSRPQK